MYSLLTEQELAKQLNVSLASIRRWRINRRGPLFVKVERRFQERSERRNQEVHPSSAALAPLR